MTTIVAVVMLRVWPHATFPQGRLFRILFTLLEPVCMVGDGFVNFYQLVLRHPPPSCLILGAPIAPSQLIAELGLLLPSITPPKNAPLTFARAHFGAAPHPWPFVSTRSSFYEACCCHNTTSPLWPVHPDEYGPLHPAAFPTDGAVPDSDPY